LSQLTEPAAPALLHRVKYQISYKKNLGNFENTEISVGLEQDGKGHPDATFAKVRGWVEENLEVCIKDVSEALGA